MSRRRFAPMLCCGVAAIGIAALLASCDVARVIAPPPSLRAASANDFAVDVEFAEPLDRASAEDITRYTVVEALGPGAGQAIFSATLVDTFYGRVVQLLISTGPLADTTDYTVEANDVRTLRGGSTGTRSVTFRTGLGYRASMQSLFDARCSACHGAAQAAGNYRTDSYAALFGSGTDATPNLVAGNPNCLLVRRCAPGRSMWDAGRLDDLDFRMINNWVASYGARL